MVLARRYLNNKRLTNKKGNNPATESNLVTNTI